jgi:tRNA1Val (adenine37-N6)-methyltransferase
MKIGTDGVLLGAWTPSENNPISTGHWYWNRCHCFMLSQRRTAEQIDALGFNAYEQTVDNFENSLGAIVYSAMQA